MLKPLVFAALGLAVLSAQAQSNKPKPKLEVEVVDTSSIFVLSPMQGDQCAQRLAPKGLPAGEYQASFAFQVDASGKVMAVKPYGHPALVTGIPACSFSSSSAPRVVNVGWDVTVAPLKGEK